MDSAESLSSVTTTTDLPMPVDRIADTATTR